MKPSARGELEITALNEMYLHEDILDVQLLGRGYAWLDTGTIDSLVEAAEFVHVVEKRQGVKISAPEEIAFRNGWITKEKLSSIRSGSVVKGQYAGCAASGQPLTEALRKDPVCRVVAVCYRSCLPARG